MQGWTLKAETVQALVDELYKIRSLMALARQRARA
jgi:hypothetical protein